MIMKQTYKCKKCCDCCPQKEKAKYEIKTTEELLTLMNMYYLEWAHRDSLMWKQVGTLFFAVFIIILLPFIKIWDISLAEKIPHFIFPLTGILLAFVFLYITVQYATRLSKIGETYRELIEYLPKKFQRKCIYEKNNINKRKQLAYTVPVIMFVVLIAFGIIILILCIKE